MRYADTGDIVIPPEQLASNASNDMLLLTSVLGVLIGIVLSYLGYRGKQMWMLVWNIGLIICSLILGITIWFDIDLFV